MTTLEAQHEVITDLILENQKLEQERDDAREALRAFDHDKKHLCESHMDMMGNCMVCIMEETK